VIGPIVAARGDGGRRGGKEPAKPLGASVWSAEGISTVVSRDAAQLCSVAKIKEIEISPKFSVTGKTRVLKGDEHAFLSTATVS
jgi:hypothetical protein